MGDHAHVEAAWPAPYDAIAGTWVCSHHGYPFYPLPGANIFLTSSDETTPDGAITCKRITEVDALRIAGEGLRWLARLVELLA